MPATCCRRVRKFEELQDKASWFGGVAGGVVTVTLWCLNGQFEVALILQLALFDTTSVLFSHLSGRLVANSIHADNIPTAANLLQCLTEIAICVEWRRAICSLFQTLNRP